MSCSGLNPNSIPPAMGEFAEFIEFAGIRIHIESFLHGRSVEKL